MKIKVKVYNMSKYNPESVKVADAEYEPVKIEVVEIPEAQIFEMGFDEADEYNEYVILTLKDGETSTFRNSRVDVFRA